MADRKNVLQEFFRGASKVLYSKFTNSREIVHSGSKGDNRELFIKEFLGQFFPQKYVIGRGEILDSAGNISRQADIVIYDESIPTFDYGSTQHFLSAGVLAHIEVKSKLTSPELKKALSITESIKALNKDTIGDVPQTLFSFIFAYEGQQWHSYKKTFFEHYKRQDLDNMVDVVCVLNKYVIVNKYVTTKFFNTPFIKTDIDDDMVMKHIASGEDSLMLFFLVIYETICKRGISTPELVKYLPEISYKTDIFRGIKAK